MHRKLSFIKMGMAAVVFNIGLSFATGQEQYDFANDVLNKTYMAGTRREGGLDCATEDLVEGKNEGTVSVRQSLADINHTRKNSNSPLPPKTYSL